MESLGDEVGGALLVLEVAVAGGDLVEELVGGDGFSWLEGVADDVAEGVVVDGLGGGKDVGTLGEVVGADGEVVLGVVGVAAEVVAADEADGGDLALGGEGEYVGSVEEEVLAEVTCG